MNVDIMVSMNQVLASFIPEKDRDEAATALITEIAEHAISEKDLKSFASSDKFLKLALREYLGEYDEADADDTDEYDDE